MAGCQGYQEISFVWGTLVKGAHLSGSNIKYFWFFLWVLSHARAKQEKTLRRNLKEGSLTLGVHGFLSLRLGWYDLSWWFLLGLFFLRARVKGNQHKNQQKTCWTEVSNRLKQKKNQDMT